MLRAKFIRSFPLKFVVMTVISMTQVQAVCIGVGCSCTVISPGLNFGAYSPTSASALLMTGTVQVGCTALAVNAQIGYTLTFSSGQSGTYTMRYMTNGKSNLNYNIYNDSAHTQVSGNGSGNSYTVTANYTILQIAAPYTQTYNIYGIIPSLQNVTAGSYVDTVILTVSY